MSEARVSARAFFFTWLVLLALAGLSFAVSFAHLGRASLPVALAIAAAKAALVALFFMELARERFTSRAAIVAAALFLALLASLVIGDVITREPPPARQPLVTASVARSRATASPRSRERARREIVGAMKPRAQRLAPSQPLVAWPNLVVTRGRRAVEVANPDFGRPQRYAPDVARVLDFFTEPRQAREFTKAFGAPASALAGLFDDLALVTPDELADAETLRRVQPRSAVEGAPSRDALGLADLLGTRRAKSFMRHRWPDGFFTAPASRRFIAALDDVAALKDVPSLATAWGAPVAAWGATAAYTASPTLMNVLYRRGYTLYLTEVERWVPSLRGLADGLARDLGLLPEHLTFQGFASRAGSGSAAHCDFDINFNVQLRGRKTWWVADNRHLTHPRIAHAMGTEPHPELLAYAKTPLPARMPRDARRFETTRGSVVFLPRGIWHRTMALAESFSLTCVLVPPSWMGLVAQELDRRLRAHEGFRAYALGLWGDGAMRDAQRAHLASLLDTLRGEVDALDPDALLTRWRGDESPPAPARGPAAPPSP